MWICYHSGKILIELAGYVQLGKCLNRSQVVGGVENERELSSRGFQPC